MVTRAVSAGKDRLTPLAILVPIIAAPMVAILVGVGSWRACFCCSSAGS